MSSEVFGLVIGKSIASPVKLEDLAEAIEFIVISFSKIWMLHNCTDSVWHKCWILAVEQIKADAERFSNLR